MKLWLCRFAIFIFFVATAGAQPSTKTIPQTEPPQWQYKTVHSDSEVNELAAVGWELVTMTSEQQQSNYLLKRSKGWIHPVLLYDIQPQYTKRAFKKGIEGRVEVSFTVLKTGLPTDITITKSLDPGLDQAAIEAFKQWRFRPGTQDGQPIDTPLTKAFTNFKINRGQRPRSWFFFIYH